jgi:hypothetical protein
VLPGLCRRSQIVMAAKVTDDQAAQEVFGSMGKRVLKMIAFVFELFLDTIIQFLIGDRRIESRNLNRLSFAAALVPIVI